MDTVCCISILHLSFYLTHAENLEVQKQYTSFPLHDAFSFGMTMGLILRLMKTAVAVFSIGSEREIRTANSSHDSGLGN